MIELKTGRAKSLDGTELIITIRCVNKFSMSSPSEMSPKEKEEREWANLLIDRLREQVTGGGWRLWNYEDIKITYTPDGKEWDG